MRGRIATASVSVTRSPGSASSGAEPCGQHPLAAHFELHIEQGPILEAEDKVIGVVTGVQGMRWYEVTVSGNDSHAGSTPMQLRHDALLAAARMIEAVNRIAMGHAPNAVGTVGLIEARPNSRNVIPGEVFFTVDFRHPEDAVLEAMEQELHAALGSVADASAVTHVLTRIWNSPAVQFDADCIAAVRAAAEQGGHPASRHHFRVPGTTPPTSRAVAPTSMIFVPCAGGVSHNELESAEPEHVAAGANVLLHAVLAMDADARRASRRVSTTATRTVAAPESCLRRPPLPVLLSMRRNCRSVSGKARARPSHSPISTSPLAEAISFR